jgi:hypothetical protein
VSNQAFSTIAKPFASAQRSAPSPASSSGSERARGADRARAELAPLHHRRVELVPALGGEHCAVAGVVVGVVLHHRDRLDHRVERASAPRQHRPARGERRLQPGAELALALGRHRGARERPAAAVDDEDGIDSHTPNSF